MPLPIIDGILTFIQSQLNINLWDGEVPRQDTQGNTIDVDTLPIVDASLPDEGLTTEWTFENAYADEGPFSITVYATTRAAEEKLLFQIFDLLASEQNWRAINIGTGNFVYKLLLDRWVSVSDNQLRSRQNEFIYRGELHYQIGVHGSVATRNFAGFTISNPSATPEGIPIALTITTVDLDGTAWLNYYGTISFTSSDSLAVLPIAATLTSGAGTFSATLFTAGTQTITAADTVLSSITGVSSGITVSFTPASLITGLTLWVAADQGAYHDAGTTLATNGQTVEQWNDLSGKGNNLLQATASHRPTFNVNKYNGLPTITFNGKSGARDSLTCAAFSSAIAQPYAVFMVVNSNKTTQNLTATILCDQLGSTAFQYSTYTGPSGNYAALAFSAGSFSVAERPSGIDFEQPLPYELVFNDPNSYVNLEGQSLISGSVSTGSLSSVTIGDNPSGITTPFTGDICEMVVLARQPTSTEETKMLTYFKQRWGIPSAITTFAGYFFRQNSPVNTQCLILVNSPDNGATWYQQFVNYLPTTGGFCGVRDPDVMDYRSTNGLFWLCHTIEAAVGFASGYKFAVASSPDGINWTPVVQVDCSAISGTGSSAFVWAPQWFIDSDNSPHIIVAISSTGSGGPFNLYEINPTDLVGFTTWSALTQITGTSLSTTMIDPDMIKIGSNYYIWFKNLTSGYIEVITSTSLTSGYTVLQSGNWLGYSTHSLEGPDVHNVSALGGWTLWADTESISGIARLIQTAGDWTTGGTTTWSAQNVVVAVGPTYFSHGGVLIGS